MRASRKTDYALRAMLDLALQVPPGDLASTAQIARRTGAPAKFLEAILSELRRAELVESRRGAEGGHRLARGADQVTVAEIWRVMDGPPSAGGRPARRRAPADGASRAIQGLWLQVEEVVARTAEGVTLAELARRAQEASKVVDFCI